MSSIEKDDQCQIPDRITPGMGLGDVAIALFGPHLGIATDKEKIETMDAQTKATLALAKQIALLRQELEDHKPILKRQNKYLNALGALLMSVSENLDGANGTIQFWDAVLTEWAKSGKTGLGMLHETIRDEIEREEKEQKEGE